MSYFDTFGHSRTRIGPMCAGAAAPEKELCTGAPTVPPRLRWAAPEKSSAWPQSCIFGALIPRAAESTHIERLRLRPNQFDSDSGQNYRLWTLRLRFDLDSAALGCGYDTLGATATHSTSKNRLRLRLTPTPASTQIPQPYIRVFNGGLAIASGEGGFNF